MARSKDHQIKFYVSDEELNKLKKNIEVSKLNQSKFLRSMAIDKKVIVIEGLYELSTQIKKIGVNLNQIAKVLNSGSIFDCNRELEHTQEELNKVWQLLNLLAQKVH